MCPLLCEISLFVCVWERVRELLERHGIGELICAGWDIRLLATMWVNAFYFGVTSTNEIDPMISSLSPISSIIFGRNDNNVIICAINNIISTHCHCHYHYCCESLVPSHTVAATHHFRGCCHCRLRHQHVTSSHQPPTSLNPHRNLVLDYSCLGKRKAKSQKWECLLKPSPNHHISYSFYRCDISHSSAFVVTNPTIGTNYYTQMLKSHNLHIDGAKHLIHLHRW